MFLAVAKNRLSWRKRKGKEEYLSSAILADTTLTKRSDMDHTVLPANYTMSAFFRKRSPDGAAMQVADI